MGSKVVDLIKSWMVCIIHRKDVRNWSHVRWKLFKISFLSVVNQISCVFKNIILFMNMIKIKLLASKYLIPELDHLLVLVKSNAHPPWPIIDILISTHLHLFNLLSRLLDGHLLGTILRQLNLRRFAPLEQLLPQLLTLHYLVLEYLRVQYRLCQVVFLWLLLLQGQFQILIELLEVIYTFSNHVQTLFYSVVCRVTGVSHIVDHHV